MKEILAGCLLFLSACTPRVFTKHQVDIDDTTITHTVYLWSDGQWWQVFKRKDLK